MSADVPEEAPAPPLTGREQQVLQGIADGLTNNEIAAGLGLSPKTVMTHRENLMNKLRIHTVAGLTRYVVAQEQARTAGR